MILNKGEIFILLSVVLNFFISIYVFSSGFLLTRNALKDINSIKYLNFKKFDKAIILLVDALRYDFAFSSNDNSVFGLKTIENFVELQPNNAKIYKFIADVRFKLEFC